MWANNVFYQKNSIHIYILKQTDMLLLYLFIAAVFYKESEPSATPGICLCPHFIQ